MPPISLIDKAPPTAKQAVLERAKAMLHTWWRPAELDAHESPTGWVALVEAVPAGTNGSAVARRRSRNSHIRSARRVTIVPIGRPARSLKPAIAFVARVTNVPLFGSLDANSQCYAATNPVLATVNVT